MASYGDAMVASRALLSRPQLLGMVQDFWTLKGASTDNFVDNRGPGPGARGFRYEQALLDSRYTELDEKQIGQSLADWVVERHGLQPKMTTKLGGELGAPPCRRSGGAQASAALAGAGVDSDNSRIG